MNKGLVIEVNGIVLGEYKKNYVLQPPVEGLLRPEVRTADGVFSGRDGGYISNQLYGKRAVTLQGMMIGNDADDYEDLRKNLVANLPIRSMAEFKITMPSGDQYILEAYPIDVQADYRRDSYGEYKIDIVAPSPYLYAVGGEVSYPIKKLIGGGYETPYALPVTWVKGTQNTTITNTGDSIIYPRIVLTGKWTNPRILNVTTNQYVELTGFASTTGDEVVFDMLKRTITLNGGNIINKRTSSSSWWGLAIGSNVIELTSTSGSDAMDGVIMVRNQYTGI